MIGRYFRGEIRAMYLRQLGYPEEILPKLHILVPDKDNGFRLDVIEDPELPLWSGQRLTTYIQQNHNTAMAYCINGKAVIDTAHLFETGLFPPPINNICYPLWLLSSKIINEDDEDIK